MRTKQTQKKMKGLEIQVDVEDFGTVGLKRGMEDGKTRIKMVLGDDMDIKLTRKEAISISDTMKILENEGLEIVVGVEDIGEIQFVSKRVEDKRLRVIMKIRTEKEDLDVPMMKLEARNMGKALRLLAK